jgi:hypothetical protein
MGAVGADGSERALGDAIDMSAMNPSRRYAINAPDVVSESFDGQVVVLNLGNGHYFSLRGIAGPIWSSLLSGHTPRGILNSIQTNRPELVEAAQEFLERVVALDLVRPQADAAGGPDRIDEVWAGDGPQIEAYEDLAELIYGDPIHDVDEQTGWPTPKPAR